MPEQNNFMACSSPSGLAVLGPPTGIQIAVAMLGRQLVRAHIPEYGFQPLQLSGFIFLRLR
jgi:hypothetical protein